MARSLTDLVALYEALVERVPDVQRKGKKTPYTSMNGNMFSFITTEERLAFRIGNDDRDAFLERFPDAVCLQYGKTMRGYVEIPDSILDDPEALGALWDPCVAHARTLKPKATTKKKK